MKTDRLVAITLFLLNRDCVSAAALAEKFEVSKRTILRDIDALCMAGVPIVSTFGVKGGYAIPDGFRPLKQMAGAADYGNIRTALQGLLSAYDSAAISATVEKALAALPQGEERIFIDFSAARENNAVNETLKIIDAAIAAQTPLQLTYCDAESRTTLREAEPLALVYQWHSWYLFAFCRKKQDFRSFKLPRIVQCEPLPGTFDRAAYGNIRALMRERGMGAQEFLDVRLLCKQAARQQAMEYLRGEIEETRENGDCVMRLNVPWERMWFSLLLGFGNQVEVLEPPELKERLKQAAAEVLGLY